MSKSDNQERDARDLETKLRQDLGLLEWQIRDLMPFIEIDRQQTRTALVEEVLREGPDDSRLAKEVVKLGAHLAETQEYWDEGFNGANATWRSILLKAKEGTK